MLERLGALRENLESPVEVYVGAMFRAPSVRLDEQILAAEEPQTIFAHRMAQLTAGEGFQAFVFQELARDPVETANPLNRDEPLTSKRLWILNTDLWSVEQLLIIAADGWRYVHVQS